MENVMYTHPAIKYKFFDLLNSLNGQIKYKNVSKKENGKLSLYNYTRKCQYENNWTRIARLARGLILCEEEQKIIALPFPKFYNYGERTYNLPKTDFTITEKLDGSLGIIYWYNNQWNVATKGSFNSRQAIWAEQWLYQNVDVTRLDPSITYLAEIIYSGNRIVINYPYEGLVILSGFSLETGKEVGLDKLSNLGFRLPSIYTYELDDLIKLCKTLDSSKEGFVVRFDNGYRVKIKGEEYCKIHKMLNKVTPVGVWNLLRECVNTEGIRNTLPEEHLKEFDKLVSHFIQIFENKIKELFDAYQNTKHLSDKELGLILQSKQHNIDKSISKYLFAIRKDKFLGYIDESGGLRNRFFEEFKPNNG